MGAHGPQPLPDLLRRSYRIGVGFNQLELGRLERQLHHPGLAALIMRGSKDDRKGLKSASEYLRQCALGRPQHLWVPQINRQNYAEIMRVGNSVNQIAAGLDNALLDPADCDMLTAIRADLLELSQALIDVRFQPDQSSDESPEVGILID
jgi:hypothetical protein